MTRHLVDPYLGKTLDGRFQVEKRLGEGSMGGVYRATDHTTGKVVALKVIHKHLARFPNIVKRFERELAITAALRSPWTVHVEAFSRSASPEMYLAMELLDGKSLSEVIKENKQLSPVRIVHIGAQIARGLAAAHAQKIIHRDLKPENIMLVREGDDADHVKILDFGVARIVEAAADEDEGANRWETLTRVGAPIGTLQYMSPQQIACEPLDELTDLYSLGIVLYEMASGAPPFKAATPRQAMQEHCFKVPEPLSTIVPGGLPKGLNEVIDALLQKEPEQRPSSAAEVVGLLERALGGGAAPARRAAPRAAGTMVPIDDTNLDLMATQEVDEHTSEVALPAPGGGKRPHRANDELVNHTMVPEDEETMLLPPVSFLGEEPPKKKNLAQRGTRNLAAAPEPTAELAPAPKPAAPAGKTTSAKPAATKPAAAKPAAAPAASKPMKPWLVALLVIFAILFTGIGVLISELIRR
jgi:hypothetical protein